MRYVGSIAILTVTGLVACGASKEAVAPDMARDPGGAEEREATTDYTAGDAVAADAPIAAQPPGQMPPSAPPPPPGMIGALKSSAAPIAAAPSEEPPGTEQFTDYGINGVVDPAKDPLSTFSIDVDTASYALARSSLTGGALPHFASVRAEEFVNYFDYGYEGPKSGPFTVHLAAAPSPFEGGHHLLRVGVQAKRIERAERKPVHLVYLVDTSGSMQDESKMGLVKKSLRLLTGQLQKGDTVALCTYAGYVREVLAPTGVENKHEILAAIDDLSASGSTAMSSGIDLAYALAKKTLVRGHANRVVVLSDGDANVGPSSHEQILDQIAEYQKLGITLSTVGFGRGNYKDTMMEQLADKGDGNYSYIDTEQEARRVFVDDLDGMLEVVARDVKIQVEFDPRAIETYRLIGYENRDIADKDFRNDKVDAGEIGAGHNVTALYDVVLKGGVSSDRSPVVVRLRYKGAETPNEAAKEAAFQLGPDAIAASFDAAPRNFRLAAAVAAFAEVLRKSPHARGWSLATVEKLAREASWGTSEQGELAQLIGTARRLNGDASGSGGAIVAK